MYFNEPLQEFVMLKLITAQEWEHRKNLQTAEKGSLHHKSHLRAGVLSILTHGKDLETMAAVHAVLQVKGDVYATFKRFDHDEDGFISHDEMKDMLGELGVTCTGDQLIEVVNTVDNNNNGKIGFDEFPSWYIKSEGRLRKEVEVVFERYDKDQSGHIDKEELHAMLTELSPHEVSHAEVDSALDELDVDKDGQVSKEEFSNWYVNSQHFQEAKFEAAEGDDEDEDPLAWPAEEGMATKAMWIISAPP